MIIKLNTLENPYEFGTREFNTFEDIKELAGLKPVRLADLARHFEDDITHVSSMEYYTSHDSIPSLLDDDVLDLITEEN